MIPVGMGLSLAAFALGMFGYCCIRNYNVTFGDLWKPTWPGVQDNVTAPAAGHKLGTINNSTKLTNPNGLPVQGT